MKKNFIACLSLMKSNFISCLSLLSIMAFFSCSSEKNANNWGDKLTQYVVEDYMPAKDYIWNWNEAVFLKSAVARCENDVDKNYLLPYIRTAVDSTFLDANGRHPNAVISGLRVKNVIEKRPLRCLSNISRSPEPATAGCLTGKR